MLTERESTGYKIPLALILSIMGLTLVIVSLFLPWWHRYDVNLGPMWSIFIFKIETKIPIIISELLWGIIRPELREMIRIPFYVFLTGNILVIVGTSLTLLPLFLNHAILQKKVNKFLNLVGGSLTLLSVITFINNLKVFLKDRGMQLFASGGPIKWGLAFGIYLAVAGGLICIISSILFLIGSESVSIELVIEKNRE